VKLTQADKDAIIKARLAQLNTDAPIESADNLIAHLASIGLAVTIAKPVKK